MYRFFATIRAGGRGRAIRPFPFPSFIRPSALPLPLLRSASIRISIRRL